MDDSTNPRARAIAALAEMFLDLAFGPEDFAAIESKAIGLGHGCMAEALGLALEAYDARLMGAQAARPARARRPRAPSPPRSATSPSPSGATGTGSAATPACWRTRSTSPTARGSRRARPASWSRPRRTSPTPGPPGCSPGTARACGRRPRCAACGTPDRFAPRRTGRRRNRCTGPGWSRRRSCPPRRSAWRPTAPGSACSAAARAARGAPR